MTIALTGIAWNIDWSIHRPIDNDINVISTPPLKFQVWGGGLRTHSPPDLRLTVIDVVKMCSPRDMSCNNNPAHKDILICTCI